MSDFWQQKIRTYFQAIDFDKDGSVTRADFVKMAERFVKSGDLTGKEADALRKNITDVWDENLNPISHRDALTQKQFIQTMTTLVGDPDLKSALVGPLPLFFKAIDHNHDDYISEDEYVLFFDILGLDPTYASKSFKSIDTDHDGRLSLQEFIDAGAEFFTSSDKTLPTQNFWGPLVK